MKKGLHIIQALWVDPYRFPPLDDTCYGSSTEWQGEPEDPLTSILRGTQEDKATTQFREFEDYLSRISSVYFTIRRTHATVQTST